MNAYHAGCDMQFTPQTSYSFTCSSVIVGTSTLHFHPLNMILNKTKCDWLLYVS